MVRFAPSPTGPLSLGNVRTALFNWLYVKHNKGKFLLRIEDTDKERSKPEFEKEIIEGLRWLGLNWDEEIYRQSERLDVYKRYTKKLLDTKKAYYCFCTPDELEEERQAHLSQGLPPIYSGKCRNISPEETRSRLKKEPAVIRFKMSEGEIEFNDLIRGKVAFNAGLIGDFIVAKNLQTPLYNFAVVVDDYEMDVTHIIRGEDHISNTPKQIALQQSLGLEQPKYAHLPLILSQDRKKLSKRFLERSLLDYKKEGYLPQALFNFLLFLGWHPKEDKDIVSVEEAIETFSLQRVQKGGAIFNQEKLDWYNAHYIRNTPIEDLLPHMKTFMPASWTKDKKLLKGAFDVEKERMKQLTDFKELADFFFELPDYSGELLIWNEAEAASKENLKKITAFLEKLPENKFTRANIEVFLVELSEKEGRGEVYWPMRVALSGKKASPGALEIIEVIGKEKTIQRLGNAIKKL